MRVKVLFFGPAHDATGFGEDWADLPDSERVTDLAHRYQQRFPRFAELSESLLIAVNQQIGSASQRLREGDEVAFLPPVSGGVPEDFYRLTREPIPTGPLVRSVAAPEDGALVTFEGIVRNCWKDRRTLFLEYEAYEPMALRVIHDIGREVKQRFAIDHIGIIHRLGRVGVGETSVAVIVSAAHRHAAFEACHFAIDRLKKIAPIWKKEHFEDGSVWAESEQRPAAMAATRRCE